MFTVDCICSRGHTFEGWFKNREVFLEQQEKRSIQCPVCNDSGCRQQFTPVRIKRHTAEKAPLPEAQSAALQKARTRFKEIVRKIESECDDVGKHFADEAIKIHWGDAEHRNIRGTATADEEKELANEGVPFIKVPTDTEDH